MTTTHAHDQDRTATLIAPSTAGYVHLAAELDPPRGPSRPVPTARTRDAFLALAPHLQQLQARTDVASVQLFHATGMPPASRLPLPEHRRADAHRFDVVVLVTSHEGVTPGTLDDVPAYRAVCDVLHTAARHVTITPARNARRIAPVPPGDRLHLFNYFLADDPEAALPVWERIAGWYQREMNLTNSELLMPVNADVSPFAFINHASWDIGLGRFLTRQLRHPTFRSVVLAGLREHEIGALPYLYRPLPIATLAKR
jgi:hypothetical protein